MTPTARLSIHQSVLRRSPYRVDQPFRPLPAWLVLMVKVVVVGGFAFGCGFLGVVAARLSG